LITFHIISRRGRRSHSKPAEKRSNITKITSSDDFVPVVVPAIDVGQLVRSVSEEQKQDASDAGNLQTNPTCSSIANPGAIDPANIIQNPTVTEEGFSSETSPRLITRSMVRATSPSDVKPTHPVVGQSRRRKSSALVETGVVQP
jgi:hypothetical protein